MKKNIVKVLVLCVLYAWYICLVLFGCGFLAECQNAVMAKLVLECFE